MGMPTDYVGRETKRALEGVGTKCAIYPGIDIDIPTALNEKRTTPEDTYASTMAALKAGKRKGSDFVAKVFGDAAGESGGGGEGRTGILSAEFRMLKGNEGFDGATPISIRA